MPDGLDGAVAPGSPVEGAPMVPGLGAADDGGFTSVEGAAVSPAPALGLGVGVPVSDPLVAPPIAPVAGAGAGAVAAALELVPVEAMAVPAHQSLLARSFGEAAIYSSSIA